MTYSELTDRYLNRNQRMNDQLDQETHGVIGGMVHGALQSVEHELTGHMINGVGKKDSIIATSDEGTGRTE